MDCFVCDKPRAHQSPVCWIHRGIAMAKWGYGAQPIELRVAGRCTIINDCWLYYTQDKAGYPTVVQYDGKMVRAHRAILLATRLHPNSSTMDAAHLCHHRRCCNPAHLVWQTHKQNVANRRPIKLKPHNPMCARCQTKLKVRGQAWCQPCFNAYYREYRRKKNTERVAMGA